ncbi:MAG: signal peptide peptidase SppA [bacterium]
MVDFLRWALANARASLVNAFLRLTRGARPYRYLRLELAGALDEDPTRAGFRRILRAHHPSLLEIVELLDDAARDPRLDGILLGIGPLACGWGQIESLSEALAAVRKAGKQVVAFLESADALGYVLAASSADRVVLHPTGAVHWAGLRAEVALFGPALEKLGVSVDLLPVGRFKSAVEPFTRSSLSDDARAALASLVDDLFAQTCAAIARGRRKSEAEIVALVDQGPFLAREALAAGLVDRLAFEDEVIAELAGGDSRKALRTLVGPRRYYFLRRRRLRPLREGAPVRVAWVPVVGAIHSGESGGLSTGTGASSRALVAALRRARHDDSVRAILLRIDSPGGSALASDVIWRAVARAKEKKPVVVSMGDYAASGGYYVAVAGTTIVAAASTLTGSIGVFGGKLSLGGLYRRIGVHKDGYGRGAHVALHSEARAFTRAERRKVRGQLEDTYRVFLERVAAGRGTAIEAVAPHAEGRVWTGRQALERGLVDATGGLGTALETLRRQLEVPSDHPLEMVSLHRPHGLLPWLAERLTEARARSWSMVDAWMAIVRLTHPAEPLAILPVDPSPR